MTVYFIRAGADGPVKIGHAINATSRLAQLQGAHWEPLRLIREIQGDATTERLLHGHYADLRLRGEWFQFCESMLDIQPSATTLLGVIPIISGRPRGPSWLTMNNRALVSACRKVGGPTMLARRLRTATRKRIAHSHVAYWLRTRVPAEMARHIEGITGIPRAKLRPDLFA